MSRIFGDSKSYLSGLPRLCINVWAYFGGISLALSWIKCRKVTTHKCPCINVLNIETEPTMGDGENWTNRKFGKLNQWKIHISPVFWVKCRKVTMHKCPHINVLNVETKPRMGDGENWTNGKFRKRNQQKICISASFPSVIGNGISVLAIMKKFKNGCHFINIDCMEKFQITDLPKFGSLVFQVSMEMEYQHWPLWKNWKMAAIS